jgi:hypothetical protein
MLGQCNLGSSYQLGLLILLNRRRTNAMSILECEPSLETPCDISVLSRRERFDGHRGAAKFGWISRTSWFVKILSGQRRPFHKCGIGALHFQHLIGADHLAANSRPKHHRNVPRPRGRVRLAFSAATCWRFSVASSRRLSSVASK